jgi:hypothetical protein
VLGRLGYDVSYVHDGAATYDGLKSRLRDLVVTAKPGDHLVFQYSGHGTEVPDVDGDEGGGPDQALVPVDFDTGAFLIDDDVRTILLELPAGVEMTCFIDCCHSATITRVFGRTAPPDPSNVTRVRFLRPTPEQIARHRRFREGAHMRALGRGLVDRSVLRWVNFSACQKGESAIETNGSGDFTRLTAQLLEGAVAARMSNHEFQRQILHAFGDARRQTPFLDCNLEAEESVLLGFAGGGSPATSAAARGLRGMAPNGRLRTIATNLRSFASELENGPGT